MMLPRRTTSGAGPDGGGAPRTDSAVDARGGARQGRHLRAGKHRPPQGQRGGRIINGHRKGLHKGEATNPGPPAADDVESLSDSEYSPEMQWALQAELEEGPSTMSRVLPPWSRLDVVTWSPSQVWVRFVKDRW